MKDKKEKLNFIFWYAFLKINRNAFFLLLIWTKEHDNFYRTYVFVSARNVKMIVISKNISGAVYYNSSNCKSITMQKKF